MKLFKTADKKFADIGFVKEKESYYGAEYIRKTEFGYVHKIHLMHKRNGKHIIQSYQEDVNSDDWNNVVGLTMYETKLCLKKMKEMGWKVQK